MFRNSYSGKRILLTGHSGFKGSWLHFWLNFLGAEVKGISLAPASKPNHFTLLNAETNSSFCDIRNYPELEKQILDFQPEMVFHLAAQAIVRRSYKEPRETYESNLLGTVNLLDACRKCASVKAILVVSSDKCYKDQGWLWGYRENDPLGGYDPYSASKACTEIIAESWRNSFFNLQEYGKNHQVLLASARAGNVIGGGDWGEDRLLTELMLAAKDKKCLYLRNPDAVRPWQHVLEAASAYLALGEKLLSGQKEFAEAWNFGPLQSDLITVETAAAKLSETWEQISYSSNTTAKNPHETKILSLDCSKAKQKLRWHSVWDADKCFQRTALWYKLFYEKNIINTEEDFKLYLADAAKQELQWTK